jgi:hypothetical protein
VPKPYFVPGTPPPGAKRRPYVSFSYHRYFHRMHSMTKLFIPFPLKMERFAGDIRSWASVRKKKTYCYPFRIDDSFS